MREIKGKVLITYTLNIPGELGTITFYHNGGNRICESFEECMAFIHRSKNTLVDYEIFELTKIVDSTDYSRELRTTIPASTGVDFTS